jgi:hypothetical protein
MQMHRSLFCQLGIWRLGWQMYPITRLWVISACPVLMRLARYMAVSVFWFSVKSISPWLVEYTLLSDELRLPSIDEEWHFTLAIRLERLQSAQADLSVHRPHLAMPATLHTARCAAEYG